MKGRHKEDNLSKKERVQLFLKVLFSATNKKSPSKMTSLLLSPFSKKEVKKRQRPTLPPDGSTIGAEGLNYSVRNGKR